MNPIQSNSVDSTSTLEEEGEEDERGEKKQLSNHSLNNFLHASKSNQISNDNNHQNNNNNNNTNHGEAAFGTKKVRAKKSKAQMHSSSVAPNIHKQVQRRRVDRYFPTVINIKQANRTNQFELTPGNYFFTPKDTPLLYTLIKTYFLPDIKEDQMLNIYLFGSRVYGNVTSSSDWDIIVVCSEDTQLKPYIFSPAARDRNFCSYHDGILNVTFMKLSEFQVHIFEHRHEAIECIFHQQETCWKETIKFELALDPDVFVRTVAWESRNRIGIAGNKIRDGHARTGKKDIIHALRYLLFAIQVFEKGQISDFSVANKYYEKVMGEENVDWKFFAREMEDLQTKLQACAKTHTFYSRWDITLQALNYVREHKNCFRPRQCEFPNSHTKKPPSEEQEENRQPVVGKDQPPKPQESQPAALHTLTENMDSLPKKTSPEKCSSTPLPSCPPPTAPSEKISFIQKHIYEQNNRAHHTDTSQWSMLSAPYPSEASQFNNTWQQVEKEGSLSSKDPVEQLHTVRFLRKHGLAAIQKYVFVIRHTEHPHVVSLVFKECWAHRTEDTLAQICRRECRGLIIDTKRNFAPVAFSLEQIAHHARDKRLETALHGAASCRELQLERCIVYEKLDGLRACLYRYGAKWYVASPWEPDSCQLELATGTAEATRFDALFWTLWHKNEYTLPPADSPHSSWCFTFQIISRSHRFITAYPVDACVLIAARDMTTLQEAADLLPFHHAYKWHLPRVLHGSSQPSALHPALSSPFQLVPATQETTQTLPVNRNSNNASSLCSHPINTQAILTKCDLLNPFEECGYVAVDPAARRGAGSLQRLQFHAPRHLAAMASAIHVPRPSPFLLLPDLDEPQLGELLRSQRLMQFLASFPDFPTASYVDFFGKCDFVKLHERFEAIVDQVQHTFDLLNENLSDEEFPKLAATSLHNFILFWMKKDGWPDVRELMYLMDPITFQTTLRKVQERNPVFVVRVDSDNQRLNVLQ